MAAAMWPCTVATDDACSVVRGVRGLRESQLEATYTAFTDIGCCIGGVRIPLDELLQHTNRELQFPLYNRAKQHAGTIQVMSLPIIPYSPCCHTHLHAPVWVYGRV